MNRCRRSPLLLIYFLLFGLYSDAASLPDAIDAARQTIRKNILPKTPGVSIAVAHDGTNLWSEGFGFADLEAHAPVTAPTQFRIGSVSKPLTAAGLMLLVEQHKLDLDADIHQYLPDYPDKGATITSRQLGGHLSGIRHYRDREFCSNQHYDSIRAALKIFENDPLLFPPGEKFSYSSYGFNLLSAVMESAAHEDFLAYLQRTVFDPLQLTNTVPDDVKRTLPDRAHFYQAGTGPALFVLAPPVDNSCKWASGGFLSTPDDLARFGSALLRPGFLQPASLKAMFTPQKTSDGKSTGYGIGWGIRRDSANRIVISHSGGSVGGTSDLLLYIRAKLVIAICCNCDDTGSSGLPLDKSDLESIAADFLPLFDRQ